MEGKDIWMKQWMWKRVEYHMDSVRDRRKVGMVAKGVKTNGRLSNLLPQKRTQSKQNKEKSGKKD